ncbi:integrase [Jiella pelagia]|uniref:Integrase n=1 Tax=Jiella pelagia TaxID=2986949 RepID=A0ABY7BYV1_9HYPH|nr:integrase [Jiella pelagia]
MVRNGIPEPHVDAIVATYHSEQAQAQNPIFDGQVRQQMQDVGLPDTLANRERAKMEIFRAKADALLNVGGRWPLIDRRQNALTATTLPEDERPSAFPAPETASAAPTTVNQDMPGGDPGREASVASDVQSVQASAGREEVAAAAPRNDEATPEPPSQATTARIERIPGVEREAGHEDGPVTPVLHLADFEAEFLKLRKNKGAAWAEASARDAHVLVVTFRDILEEQGVAHSGEIRQHHIAALRQHYNDVPARYGQSARQRAMRPAELRAFAADQAARAEAQGEPPYAVGLSAATIRKHFGNLDTFLRHLRASGYAIGEWELKGLRPAKPKPGTIRLQQVKPSPQTIRPIFDLPVFTGCRDEFGLDVPGNIVFHGACYFLPMLFAYLGARRNEFAGLGTSDILQTDSGPAIHIRQNQFRGIKNPQSDRMLPVPDELLRLGFMDYVAAISGLGYRQLFPELYSPDYKTVDPGDRFYKDFIPLLNASPEMKDGLWKRTIHAFRHGLADTLKQSGVEIAIIDDLSGRLGSGETQTRYTNAAGLPLLLEKIRGSVRAGGGKSDVRRCDGGGHRIGRLRWSCETST